MAEKVLIIDDDPETIKFLSVFLKRLGYEPVGAKDGMTALKIAHERHPDLIILDVMMPGMDGYEVARSLRRHPETAMIPILMFTAKTQVEDKLTGYDAGVDIYLTKPVHPVELQANIKALLAKSKVRSDTLTKKGYVVGVIAAKGGLGVSTVALNLAIAYRKNKNAKVIAAEMKPGQGSWADELGLVSPNGLVNLLRMNLAEITPAAVEKQLVSNTFGVPLLLASNEACAADCVGALDQLENTIEALSTMADVVVLDLGTSFHPAYDSFMQICDEIVLVTEPQPISVKRTRALVSDLRTHDFGSAKAMTVVMVNRARTEMTMTISQIEEAIGQSVALGFPPMPELAYQSATRSDPLYMIQPDGTIAHQFNALADQISHHIDR